MLQRRQLWCLFESGSTLIHFLRWGLLWYLFEGGGTLTPFWRWGLYYLFGGTSYFDTFLEAYDVPSQLESFRFSLFRLRSWMASLPTYQRTWISLICHLDLDILWLFIFSIAERQFFLKHTFYEKNRQSHRSISRENCNCLGFLVISSSSILRCLLLLAERWSGSSSWSVTSSVSLWQSSSWWLLRSMFCSFSVTAVTRAKSNTSNAQDFFILVRKFNYFWISPSVENPNDGEGILGPCVIWTIHQARVTSGHSWTSTKGLDLNLFPSSHSIDARFTASPQSRQLKIFNSRFNSLFLLNFVVPLPICFLFSGLEKIQLVQVQKSFTTSCTGASADKSSIQNI